MTVKTYQKSFTGNYLMLPTEVFNERIADRDSGRCQALRKTYNEGKIYMQAVYVEIIASYEDCKIVKGVYPEDVLFIRPVKLLRDYAEAGFADKEYRFIPPRGLNDWTEK